jgi:hypothetical protein
VRTCLHTPPRTYPQRRLPPLCTPSYPKSSQEAIVKKRINQSAFPQSKSTVLQDKYKPCDGILISQKARTPPPLAQVSPSVVNPLAPVTAIVLLFQQALSAAPDCYRDGGRPAEPAASAAQSLFGTKGCAGHLLELWVFLTRQGRNCLEGGEDLRQRVNYVAK